MIRFPVLRVVAKLLIPYILLFSLYVQFHGDFGPGGGFQAGVIFASGVILYGLVFGLEETQRAFRSRTIEVLIPAGVLLYAGTGIVSMLCGGNFLDYHVFEHHWGGGFLPHGQHLGIFVVELGVGITVASVMISIFYAFAGRGEWLNDSQISGAVSGAEAGPPSAVGEHRNVTDDEREADR